MHVNYSFGLLLILVFPYTYGFHAFSLIWELYKFDDPRMFGELSEIFNNDLIPYPERNLL